MKKTKRLSLAALLVAVAFVLSFLESLVPINLGIPGVKIGLANIVVLFALYSLKKSDAFFISMVRILVSGLVFTGAFSLSYSFAGGILSFAIMLLAMKCDKISTTGVSILGAVSHNLGQIIVAALVMNTYRIVYYLPVLIISGTISGIAVGIVAGIIINRLNNKKEL